MDNKAFTLLEILVTIFIITIGLLATLAAIDKTLRITSNYSKKLSALALAQEGVEIVRNIRDSNFIEEQRGSPEIPWNRGFSVTGEYEADYTYTYQDLELSSYTGRYLKTDNQGFYFYSSSPDYPESVFQRKIIINEIDPLNPDPNGDSLEVKVEVYWPGEDVIKTTTVNEYLYNWQ